MADFESGLPPDNNYSKGSINSVSYDKADFDNSDLQGVDNVLFQNLAAEKSRAEIVNGLVYTDQAVDVINLFEIKSASFSALKIGKNRVYYM